MQETRRKEGTYLQYSPCRFRIPSACLSRVLLFGDLMQYGRHLDIFDEPKGIPTSKVSA